MNKIIIFLLFIGLVSFDNHKEDAFGAGEWFKFRIISGVIKAGYATREVREGVINNKIGFRVIGKG